MDFNYHEYIYEKDDRSYRTETRGSVCRGSGLNTVANYPWDTFARIKWDYCGINAVNCFTRR